MSIFNHFQHINLSQGQREAIQKMEGFLNGSTQVFMLKGYAGSGKTTILKGLIEYLSAANREFIVMAPTGRAAKILREKTGHGITIHRGIYKLSELQSLNSGNEDESEQSFHFFYPIQDLNTQGKVIIVDEASMISNVASTQELFSFGTDVVFQDLLTYAKIKSSNNKIIFVGDPAQLPPVSDSKSTAFDRDFFTDAEISFEEVEMEEVFRQDKDSGLILKNALKIRNLLKETVRNSLEFEFDQHSMTEMKSADVVNEFLNLYPQPSFRNGVIITYSNSQALIYNQSIRNSMFPGSRSILPGDMVVINNNVYSYYGQEINNGDMAMVLEVSDKIEQISAPVMVSQGGKKVRKIINIKLRNVVLKLNNDENSFHCKIFEDLLNSPQADNSVYEAKALYINFVMRFNQEQKQREQQGLPKFKVGSPEFKQAYLSDPNSKALKVKYAYAITCHKAQGGEWDTVFVDYTGRAGLNDNALRWCYTASTRAVKKCYAVNSPKFSVFTKLKISETKKISSPLTESLNLENIPLSPFHHEKQHRCKSLKYWQIEEKLKETPYQIKSVESKGEFLERYIIQYEDMEIVTQATHNGAGFFSNFVIQNHVTDDDLLSMLNDDSCPGICFNYFSENVEFMKLYNRIQLYCDELNIIITNIQETINQYYIIYHLKTDGKFSYIQFYFDKNKNFTHGLPKSDLGPEDEKLNKLIQKLIY